MSQPDEDAEFLAVLEASKNSTYNVSILDDKHITNFQHFDKKRLSELGIDKDVEIVVAFLPDINRDYVASCLAENIGKEGYKDELISILCERDDYPKEPKHQKITSSGKMNKESAKIFDKPVNSDYKRLTCSFLSRQFPRIPLPFLLKQAQKFNFHLYPTMIYLLDNVKESGSRHGVVLDGEVEEIAYLPWGRRNTGLDGVFDDTFFLEQSLVDTEQERRNKLATGKAFNSLMECSICAEECLLEEFVQCTNDCDVCVFCYARNLLEGVKYVELRDKCLLSCGATYTESAFQKCVKFDLVPDSSLEQYYSIAANKLASDEKLVKALGDNKVTCPHCNQYFCVMDNPDDIEFRCLNPRCLIKTCRKCGKVSHLGKKCEKEIETAKDQYHKWVEVELDKIFARYCPLCKKPGIRESGCNWVKCTCGGSLCILCGKASSDAEHGQYGQPGNHFATCKGPAETWEAARARLEAQWKKEHPGIF